MNSCLYRCRVMHHRMEPKKHAFHYNIFMFYLDLDEIDSLSKKLAFLSRNRFNFFNFRDSDHLQLPKENPDTSKNVKEHLKIFLHQNGIERGEGKTMLLTNLCTIGYAFNPVSFYYCYDEKSELKCAVVEICNTFKEMKLFLIGKEHLKDNKFHLLAEKYFYVSPFIDADTSFDFNLFVPGEKLNIRIDDYQKETKFFTSTLTGHRKALTNINMLLYAIRFPLITLQIIGLIHWQALKLWIKKLPFHKKNANMHLQRDVLKPYNS